MKNLHNIHSMKYTDAHKAYQWYWKQPVRFSGKIYEHQSEFDGGWYDEMLSNDSEKWLINQWKKAHKPEPDYSKMSFK